MEAIHDDDWTFLIVVVAITILNIPKLYLQYQRCFLEIDSRHYFQNFTSMREASDYYYDDVKDYSRNGD